MEKKKQSDYFNYEMISEEEKQNILKDLDMEFSSHFKAPENGSRYKSFSSGLTLPAMVALIALILGIVTILISDRFLIRSRPAVISTSRDWNSESEWAVLKAYQEDVVKKLLSKDKQIETYEKQIEEYDQKLEVLRNLIDLKKKTDGHLSEEREKLVLAGYDNDAIESRILEMEEHLLSDLAPEMVDFYGLSIDELNKEIDGLLYQKEGAQRELESARTEKELLVKEKSELDENLGVNRGTNLSNQEDILGESELNRQQRALFTQFTQSKYIEIIDDVESGELLLALQKLDRLEELFKDVDNNIMTSQEKAYHTKVQEAVKHAIIEKKEFQEEKALWTKGESPLLEELKTLTEDLEYEYYTENYTSAEEKLRQKIESVPELAAAFDILQKIESERNNTTREESSALPPVAATPRKTETPPRGNITNINFNRLTIESEEWESLKKGMKFTVVRKKDNGEVIMLGQGKISGLDGRIIEGELETLYDFSQKPAVNDLIIFGGEN